MLQNKPQFIRNLMQNLRNQGFDPSLKQDLIVLDESGNVCIALPDQLVSTGFVLCYKASEVTVNAETFADLNHVEKAHGYQLIKTGGTANQLNWAVAKAVFISEDVDIRNQLSHLQQKFQWYSEKIKQENVSIQKGNAVSASQPFIQTDNVNYQELLKMIDYGISCGNQLGINQLFICQGTKAGLGVRTTVVECMTNFGYQIFSLNAGEAYNQENEYDSLYNEISAKGIKACILIDKLTSDVLLKNFPGVFDKTWQRLMNISQSIPVCFCTSLLNLPPVTPFITTFVEINDQFFIGQVIKSRLPQARKYYYDYSTNKYYANPLKSLLKTIKYQKNYGIQRFKQNFNLSQSTYI